MDVTLSLFLRSLLALDLSLSSFPLSFISSTRWSSLNRIPAPPSVCTQCSMWTPVTRSTPTATTTTCRSASAQTSAGMRQLPIEMIKMNMSLHIMHIHKWVCVCLLWICVLLAVHLSEMFRWKDHFCKC